MIPHKLHHIWVGPKPVPQDWVEAWREMHPGWEVKVWREADIDQLDVPRRDAYEAYLEAGVWHGAADLARVAILDAVGGVYTDIDSRPLRSLEGAPFMAEGFFAAYEPPNPHLPGRVANGTIGAEAGHPILTTYRRLLAELTDVSEPWASVGAPTLTRAMALHKWQPLPARTFYPKSWKGLPVPGNQLSYAEHFWATTTHGYPVRAVVLVPRRAGVPERDAIWAWCRGIWEQQGWPIFEGHHDEPGLFNASKARNAAAKAAGDWDVAIFADADTVPWDWKPVKDAVPLAARTGKFIRPFSAYHMLDEGASKTFMDTGVVPKRGDRVLRESAYGGIHVVSRRLWDRVEGYDERFLGWGSEDAAFEFACRAVGGFMRLRGDVYHLYHPMQQRDPSTPQFQANVALGGQYRALQHDKAGMLSLIAEREGRPRPFRVGLVMITNGRRDCISKTIPSIAEHIGADFAEKLICDDSGDPSYVRWLRQTFPDFVVYDHPRIGHGPAVAYALRRAAAMDVDWVFFSEDDYEFTRPVELKALAEQMIAHPTVTQMVLRRQAWFPAEVEAGGMIERFDPALFTERSHNGSTWIEHRQFYSLNPHLTRRSFIASHPWPRQPNSEHIFSRILFRHPVSAGIWGSKADAPWAIHFGERVGVGY